MTRKGFEILRTPEQREAHKAYVNSLKREEITGYLRTETGEEYHARHRKEGIREGVAERIYRWYFRNSDLNDFGVWTEVSGATRGMVLAITDIVLEYESSQGVVIQVVPDDSPQIFRAVEPLISK